MIKMTYGIASYVKKKQLANVFCNLLYICNYIS